MFELIHELKRIQQKKYKTFVDELPVPAAFWRIAQWQEHFIPQADRLCAPLDDYKHALIDIWAAYDTLSSLFQNKKFIRGRLSISQQFVTPLAETLETLLAIIKTPNRSD